MREGVDVRLLHHVFGVGFVLDDGARHAVDALVVPPHQDLEQRRFSGADPLDDFGVSHHSLESRAPLDVATRAVVTFSRPGDSVQARRHMTMKLATAALVVPLATIITAAVLTNRLHAERGDARPPRAPFDRVIGEHAEELFRNGATIFRYDTFGDEAFWGGTLKLHQAIAGARFGGVGPGVSPRTALAVGLKIDVAALPDDLVDQIGKGKVNLDDPAVTLALLRLNAGLGATGEFNASVTLKSIGIQCALCHST